MSEPPIIDFGRKTHVKICSHTSNQSTAFYGADRLAKEQLVDEIRQACERFGFFQLINHGIPTDIQTAVLKHSSEFFNLPLEHKEKYNQGHFHPYISS